MNDFSCFPDNIIVIIISFFIISAKYVPLEYKNIQAHHYKNMLIFVVALFHIG